MRDVPRTMHKRIEDLFREACNQPSMEVRDEATNESLPGWDSLAHVNLLLAVEREFRVRFTVPEMLELSSVGGLKALLRAKGVGDMPREAGDNHSIDPG